MMKLQKFFLLAGTVAALAVTLGAQQVWVQRDAGGPPPPPPPPGAIDVTITAQAPTFEFIAAEPAFMEKTVAGAPYSADAVSETTRVLADGTRIKNTTTSKVYRDSEGRVRKEQSFGHIGFWVSDNKEAKTQISIIDPVAKQTIILDPDQKTARVIAAPQIPPFPPPPPGPEAGKEIHIEVTGNDSVGAPVTDEEVVKMKHAIERRVEVVNGTRVVTTTESGGMMPPPPPPPPPAGGSVMFFRTVEDSDNTTTESLGEQTIQGVAVTGTRKTTTIPTGMIGNDRPIVSVVEEWYSPELQVMVQRTIKDPQVGETVYRLENLSRAEPLKSLFEIPTGYDIKETAPRIEMLHRKIQRDGE